MQADEANTPARRIYFPVMMMYLDEGGAQSYYHEFAQRLTEFMGAISNPKVLVDCVEISKLCMSGEYYKALMLSGIPNFLYTIGYTNASWTLKADLVSDYAVRLLRHMDEKDYRRFEVARDPEVGELPFMDLASGYIQRALDEMPKQGDQAPWRLKQNYLVDLRTMSGAIADDVIEFS